MITHYYLTKLLLFLLTLVLTINSVAKETNAIDSDEVFSAIQLVTAVLQANPQLKVARATWQASVTRIEQQSSLDDPQFQYSFAPLTIDAYHANGQQSDFSQRFEISQKVPFPGKLHLRAKAAEYKAETKQHDIVALQLLLASSAKSLFADWYFIHQAIAINQRNQTLLNEFHDIAVTRYSTGRASKQDVLSADVELVLLKHQFIDLQRQRKIRLAQINTLLNRPIDSVLPIPQRLPEITKLPNLEQLQIKAMQSHPELKVIAANINVHKTRTELAALAYYPDLKLSAGYNSLWDNKDKRFNIGVGINIPLNQSKRRAAEQEANADSQQATWRKVELQAKINEELAIAYANVEDSLHVLHLYRQQLSPLANERLFTAKADYEAGKGDFLSLISSEKNRLQTQLKIEQAFTDVHRRVAELEQAVGSLEPLSTVELARGSMQ